jgi:hypothetical protein
MNNLIINHITNIFESGNYELAFALLEGQGLDICDMNVDFNKMVVAEDYSMFADGFKKYHKNIELNGIRISIACDKAGVTNSFFSTVSNEFLAFEVGITIPKLINPDVFKNESILISSFDTTSGNHSRIESIIIFNYLKSEQIIKIIKILLNEL